VKDWGGRRNPPKENKKTKKKLGETDSPFLAV